MPEDYCGEAPAEADYSHMPSTDPFVAGTFGPLISVNQAATRLGVNPSTVRAWCAKGLLQATRLGARSWAIPEAALDRFQRPKVGAPARKPRA